MFKLHWLIWKSKRRINTNKNTYFQTTLADLEKQKGKNKIQKNKKIQKENKDVQTTLAEVGPEPKYFENIWFYFCCLYFCFSRSANVV